MLLKELIKRGFMSTLEHRDGQVLYVGGYHYWATCSKRLMTD